MALVWPPLVGMPMAVQPGPVLARGAVTIMVMGLAVTVAEDIEEAMVAVMVMAVAVEATIMAMVEIMGQEAMAAVVAAMAEMATVETGAQDTIGAIEVTIGLRSQSKIILAVSYVKGCRTLEKEGTTIKIIFSMSMPPLARNFHTQPTATIIWS